MDAGIEDSDKSNSAKLAKAPQAVKEKREPHALTSTEGLNKIRLQWGETARIGLL
jgi:hypothetical protein